MAQYPTRRRITFIALLCVTKSLQVSPFASIRFHLPVQRSPSKCLQMPNGNVPICCRSESVYYRCEEDWKFRAGFTVNRDCRNYLISTLGQLYNLALKHLACFNQGTPFYALITVQNCMAVYLSFQEYHQSLTKSTICFHSYISLPHPPEESLPCF